MPHSNTPHAGAPAADESINLPLIDISVETPEAGKALVNAAVKWGFLWIISSPPPAATDIDSSNYDFDEKTVDNVFELSKKFFTQAPLEEKLPVRIKHNRGWVDMHVENLDPSKHKRGDFKQAFNLAEPIDGKWQQPLPATFQKQEEDLKDFHRRCRSMANRILRLLALGLDISEVDWFAKTHDAPSQQTTRFLYYPPLQGTDYEPEVDIRAGAHSDYGSITLLLQRAGQPGLEILTPEETWASVPIFPPKYHSSTFPPVLVNIGDLLSYWTNGYLRSTIHRVILTNPTDSDASGAPPTSKGEDRFSIAVFLGPQMDTPLVPVPSPAVAARAEQFAAESTVGHGGGATNAGELKTLTAGEHLSNRLKATYGAVYEPETKA